MGFSKSNTTVDGWKCDKCNRFFLNAEDAEDCCVELGEPDELPMYNQAVNKIKALEAKLARLVEAAKKFSDRLDFVHEHNDFKAIWFLAHSHYGDYKGPRYEQEFKELKAAIEAARVKP